MQALQPDQSLETSLMSETSLEQLKLQAAAAFLSRGSAAPASQLSRAVHPVDTGQQVQSLAQSRCTAPAHIQMSPVPR